MIKRLGSMIFDVILGLAAFLFIMALTMPTIIHWEFINEFKDFVVRTDSLVQKAVVDPYKGYASASSSYCAPDYINSFQNITAYRIIKCSQIENNVNFYYDSALPANETDPTKSYFKDMEKWTHKDSLKEAGCYYYFSSGTDNSQYSIYFDCSGLRKAGIADSEILTYFKKKYPVQLISYNLNALSIDPAYIPIAGEVASDDDGKILLIFQK
jgi:hypothetical protein